MFMLLPIIQNNILKFTTCYFKSTEKSREDCLNSLKFDTVLFAILHSSFID